MSGGRALRLALVGRGPWSQNFVRTAARIDGIEISATAGRDWRGLLATAPDGAIVSTTPASHLEVAEGFVGAGIGVLVEKPLCLELAGALRFRDLVERRRVVAMVDHIHLYSPAWRLLKRLSPGLGRITRIEARGGREGPYRRDVSSMWDWGSHYVAMAIDLLGREPGGVAARRTLREPMGEAFAENYELRLDFGGGVDASIAVGNRMPHTRRIEVVHERGILVYDDLASPKLSGPMPDLAQDGLDKLPLDVVLEEFRDALRAGRFVPGRVDLAASVVRVLESAQRTLS
jgi:predicted dehydrogenase